MKLSFSPLRFLLATAAFIPFVADAALTWATKQLDLTAMVGTSEIATSFSFHNEGDRTVTISSLRTSCECTTAEIEKRDYRPGESGRIEVRFHPGERTGLADRIITVTTADKSVITLRLRVNLFEPASCNPQILTWEKDSPALEQTVEISANASSLICLIDLGKNDLKNFASVRVEPIEPFRRYRLSIIPLDLHHSGKTSLQCRIGFTDGSVRRLTLSTVIK